MQRLEVSGAVRPLQWPFGVKGLRFRSSGMVRLVDWETVTDVSMKLSPCMSKIFPEILNIIQRIRCRSPLTSNLFSLTTATHVAILLLSHHTIHGIKGMAGIFLSRRRKLPYIATGFKQTTSCNIKSVQWHSSCGRRK